MLPNHPTCPICAGPVDAKFCVSGYPIAACLYCTHQFANIVPKDDHVAEQFSDKYFFGGGTSGYQDYLSSAILVKQGAERYTDVVRHHCNFGQDPSAIEVLDVGCAAGFVMQGFAKSGWSVTGIDPNRRMVEQSRDRGFEAHVGTLETIFDRATLADSKNESFDLVSMIQVVAHLSNMTKAATNLRRLVRENGFILVETWDSASITAKALGESWHEYSPPNVLHYFSKKSVDGLMANAGFGFIAGGRPAKRITTGHARSLFDFKYGKTRWGKAMLRASQIVSDNRVIPYPAEDLFWRIYQKKNA